MDNKQERELHRSAKELINQISLFPLRLEEKAIWLPPGDQAGNLSRPLLSVKRRWSLPSALIT